MSNIRVRFAPSPTGGLHLGGVRTVLFNYLFAKKYGGRFVLRIEDTDQSRLVHGAEAYIFDCLKWCGLVPDESPMHGGPFVPYRQSERKELYLQYAEKLVKEGNAYYAFDTPEELEQIRAAIPNFQYNKHYRKAHGLRNSLSLEEASVNKLLAENAPYVIRIKIPAEDFVITCPDMIRGDVAFDSAQIDDKVLLKADGMPTYHLAVVVDDYLMKISHVFRGEEWLPSAPVHILLWQYLFGLDKMPLWAHLPLILKPDGNGKLSKRDGDRLGFPVYAMDWKDPKTNEITRGFKELGFLPEAFINLLAVLGWNDGTAQEIFSKAELIEKFSIEKVHKGGAKFDFEKAKWFNHEWIKRSDVERLRSDVEDVFRQKGIRITESGKLDTVIALVKDRCILLQDFYVQGQFFFVPPSSFDEASVKPKWDESKKGFFEVLAGIYAEGKNWSVEEIERLFKDLATEKNIKTGELQMIFRVMLVGAKIGPGVFIIAETIGKEETVKRIRTALLVFG